MPNPVPLASAASFAVLAGSGITVGGAINSTLITGNVGTYPTATETGFGNLLLTGVNHDSDALTQTAKTDLMTAYSIAAPLSFSPLGQNPTTTVPTQLGSTTLGPGVYNSTAGTFTITGTFILDAGGNPNAIFIFQAASTLITDINSRVVLINGAQACNCFWQVGSSATLGSNSLLVGTVMALSSITMSSAARINGRLLAYNGAVSLDTNSVVICMLTIGGLGIAPIGVGLNPAALINANSCLKCMSEKELKAIIAYAMRTSVGLTLAQVNVNSATYKTISKKDMLVAFTVMITNQLVPGVTASELRKLVHCSSCGSDKAIEAAILYLFTNFFQTTAV